MAQFFIARQPIYDRSLKVIGYELLYRDSDVDSARFDDPERASSDAILNSFIHIGIDTLTGSGLVFINLPKAFITNEALTPMFRDQCVLEVLEDITATPDVLLGLERLSQQGFKLALDDFELTPETRPLLRWAHYVKVDVLGRDREELAALLTQLRRYPVQIIAEKVETQAMKQVCEELGFDCFQGYFYCRPQVVMRKSVAANKAVVFDLLGKLQQPEVGFDELEALLAHDITLSYKLLRYINSAAFSLRREVDSIKEAIVLLGIDNVKHWLALILMTRMDDSKPWELITTALVRARLCERIADQWYPEVRHQMFIVGLFSVLDALMDQPMVELLDTIILTMPVKLALLDQEGLAGEVFQKVLAYEQMDFASLDESPVSPAQWATAYLEAVKWADDSMAVIAP
ncbi:EAL and HDOD domain-containing protein [Saccharospirillum impatiens]|uniref:EAL and HDOD domain-containing protein n=1 Tax=Saccharospirillum impatiens TaxID=169438 RepID=UPI00040BFF8B|nr:HDOD domain-containing protein [Saccharospirillum impatiens]